VFDIMTGLHAGIGMLAALHHRERTGEGQHVEVNLLSTALAAMANHSSTVVAGGVVPYRMGNAHPSLFPYEPFPTGDGELVVVAANDGQFRLLAHALGRPELLEDPRFATTPLRNANREALRPLLHEALATASAQEWFERLTAAGVPCGPINTIDGGIALADSLGLDPVVQVGDGAGAVPMIRSAITLSATPAAYRSAPPTLGQHDTDVRAWLAGPAEEHA
jgi:crotonobetainyl-CoA:carnitine CoA-transferase CaiB-like acyl-CoA transferase